MFNCVVVFIMKILNFSISHTKYKILKVSYLRSFHLTTIRLSGESFLGSILSNLYFVCEIEKIIFCGSLRHFF